MNLFLFDEFSDITTFITAKLISAIGVIRNSIVIAENTFTVINIIREITSQKNMEVLLTLSTETCVDVMDYIALNKLKVQVKFPAFYTLYFTFINVSFLKIKSFFRNYFDTVVLVF